MSADPWSDDYVPQAATHFHGVRFPSLRCFLRKHCSFNTQDSQSPLTQGVGAQYKIEDTTARGSTTYKPQIKILRREDPVGDKRKTAVSQDNQNIDNKSSPMTLHEQLKEREKNYMKAREKILGKESREDSQPKQNQRIKRR
jgi:hypothetical protein